ncbi:MAG: hypothetical protein J4N32_03645 [Chloroflexi bacterium]|nr:hypothetical protein [Chloroflexota bacterium]
MQELAPYQTEIAHAVLDSVLHERGLTITVEMARGAGAREIAAQLEVLLLGLHVNESVRLLHVGPAHRHPDADRLARHLRAGAASGLTWVYGNRVRLGRAEVCFLTPEEAAAAHGPFGLLQVTNAEALDPTTLAHLELLAAASGATTVLYGTAWNGETAFEARKQANRRSESAGLPRRHFRVPWQQAADELPGYGGRVSDARDRLGEASPEFQARYALVPTPATGPLVPEAQQRALDGDHARRHAPTPGVPARASIVVTRLPQRASVGKAGLGWDAPAHGATAVVTIAEDAPGALRVIEHRWLEAPDAQALAQGIAEVVGETWGCTHLVADAPGASPAAASQLRHLLARALGRPQVAWTTSAEHEASAQALGLMAAAHTGRVRLYRADGSPEYRILRHEIESASAAFAAGGHVSVELPSADEGFLRGLLLLADPPGHTAAVAAEPEAALAS